MSQAQSGFSQNKNKALIRIAILALLAILGLVYFSFIRSPKVNAPPAVIGGGNDRLFPKSGLDSLVDLQQADEYKRLEKFGDWPMQTEPKGRQNPFITPSQ